MDKIYKKELQDFISSLEKKDERIIDILVEIQRRYQLEPQELYKLLNKQQKEKLKKQELKYKTIKE